MSLDKFSSNKKLIDRIEESIKCGKVFHAYIIEGDGLSGKEDFARELCKAVLCEEAPGTGCDRCLSCRKIDHGNYEDLYYIEADGMSVKDEQVSKLQSDLKKKPTGPRNLAIIQDADTMTTRAQNRLLKTLEEPYQGTVIMLLSENRENLLETIRSRCVTLRLENTAEGSEKQHAASEIFQVIHDGKSFYETKALLMKNMKSREDALILLDGLERIYREILVGRDSRSRLYRTEEICRAIELIEEARRDLYAKVNYQYALKNLILKIGG